MGLERAARRIEELYGTNSSAYLYAIGVSLKANAYAKQEAAHPVRAGRRSRLPFRHLSLLARRANDGGIILFGMLKVSVERAAARR